MREITITFNNLTYKAVKETKTINVFSFNNNIDCFMSARAINNKIQLLSAIKFFVGNNNLHDTIRKDIEQKGDITNQQLNKLISKIESKNNINTILADYSHIEINDNVLTVFSIDNKKFTVKLI